MNIKDVLSTSLNVSLVIYLTVMMVDWPSYFEKDTFSV